MPDTSISLNMEKDKLFIAICKMEGHSFVMVGVYDKDEGKKIDRVTHILCRVGKVAVSGSSENQGYFFLIIELIKLLFGGTTKAKIKDEGISRVRFGGTPITYQAYDLSYSQYIEFIQLIEGLQTPNNKFQFYKPVSENGSQVTFELTNELVFYSNKNLDDLKTQTCELGINNNCRHSAITLIEKTTHAPLSSLISSNFITALPYNTQLDYGKPSQNFPFYVLPVSPTGYPELNQEKKKILSKLYGRMEQMLLIAPESLQTQNKFDCLKKLYNQIIGPQKNLSLHDLLLSIRNWHTQNKTTLDELRETYFWDSFFQRESATTMMVNEIVEDLEQAQLSQIN